MRVTVAVLLCATVAFAQATSPPPPPPPPPPPSGSDQVANPAPTEPPPPAAAADSTTAVAPPSQTYFGVHVGLNLGLVSVDAMINRFYVFAAGNFGVPLVTNGGVGAVIAGIGYNIAISQPGDSMWFMDFIGMVPVGWLQTGCFVSPCPNQPYGGFGVGVGFRLLHRSGFTLGFKIPVFGFTVGPAASAGSGFQGASSVGLFYLAALIALPLVSFGFRF